MPLLVGSNRDESFDRMEPTAVQFIAESKRRYGALAEAFLKLYPAESDDQAGRDSAFAEGRDELAWVMGNWARTHASRQVQSFGAKILAGGPPDPAQSSFFQAYYEHALCLD